MFTSLLVVWSRVRGLFHHRRDDAEFDDEMSTHLAMLVDDDIRRGRSPAEARRSAILRFGGPMQIKEQQHDGRGVPFVETTLQDIRYGLRALGKNRAYALVAVATLAIGIGAGTTGCSCVGAVLLRPRPDRNPGELVRVFETNPLKNWTRNIASPANYADWKRDNSVFTGIAAYEQFSEVGSGASEQSLTATASRKD